MKKNTTLFLLFILLLSSDTAFAQYGEPEVQGVDAARNLFDEGYKTGIGFSFNLNDFGFGAGVQLRKGLNPYTEGLLNFKIAGLRDPSEQTYIDFYFGNRTIPSKYKRVVTFPLTVGLKRRLFANQISDNFRFHTSIVIGPTFALTTPYFQDYNNNGYRESNTSQFAEFEPVQDIFRGLKDAETQWGWTGDVVLGIDFGDNFAKLQSFQFGYTFNYFRDGMQILEPYRPNINDAGQIIDNNGNGVLELDPNNDGLFDDSELLKANDATKFFGSAQITFIFGWMW